jgi:hypothetical protein
MKKIVFTVLSLIALVGVSLGASFAKDCCNGGACCKNGACCRAHHR